MSYRVARRPLVIRQTGFVYQEVAQSSFAPFISIGDPTLSPLDDAEPAFYLGFDAAFPEQPVTLFIEVSPRAFSGRVVKQAAAFSPSSALPQVKWEYFDGAAWQELPIVDETNDLTESGTIQFLTPV